MSYFQTMDFNPDEHGLPAFLDPAFDWLATKLPPTVVDNLVIPGLSRLLAFSYSLYDLVLNMASQKPGAWDAEKILPPVITLLGAYLALLSFYRTTSWMLRTTFWFVKWGTLFGALMGGIGYLAGQQGNGDMINGIQTLLAGGTSGIAKAVGATLWDIINSPGNDGQQSQRRPRTRSSNSNSASNRQTRSSKSSKSGSSKSKGKSNAYDSSERNRGSRAQDGFAGDDDTRRPADAQKIMGQIVGFAEKMGWMGAIRDTFGGGSQSSSEREEL
jgi:hypothetical protein